MQQDFKLFRWLDILTFCGVNSIPTFCLIYSLCYGLSGQPLFMVSLVTACFWGCYFLFLYNRKKYLNRITFVTKHQIAIIANEFSVKQSDIENLTDEIIQKWNAACNFNKSAESLVGLWVEFRPFPVILHSKINPLAGYLIGNSSVVGWKEDLKSTAFQHELGHKIHEVYAGYASNDACHKFMTDHSLP